MFRLSGKRFILAVHSLADYEKCGNEVRALFQNTFQVDGDKISFPVAICGIVNGETMGGADTLLAYLEYMAGLVADTKEIVVLQSNEKLMEGFRYEQEVEHFLVTAIEEDLFEVFYQPVYSINEGEYVTLEALSRLRHPTLGYIPPDVFIALAEKNGQISRIGQLQFRRVCRFIQEHEEIMDVILNVKFNLSPLELLKFGYAEDLLQIIEEYDLDNSYFQFEITETAATECSENFCHAAAQFMRAGIGICLDDFGSGYANLSTVLKLPFSAIKLDRSLLNGVSDSFQSARFYRSIVMIFRDMGYQVIAEGVETEEQMKLLSEWGVDMIQGFYFSKPLKEEELLKILSK